MDAWYTYKCVMYLILKIIHLLRSMKIVFLTDKINEMTQKRLGKKSLSLNHRVYLKSVVCPTAKFHITLLIVEGEPRDIDLTRTLEYSRWYEYTATIAVYHHVGCVRAVESFVSAKNTIQR